jgi:hypothetical protein
MGVVLAVAVAGSITARGAAPGGMVGSPVTEVIPASASRDYPLDDHWKFVKADDPKANAADYQDEQWRTVNVPHDWSVESAFDQNLASCTAFLPCGVGWYRKHILLPASAAGKTVTIRFDGVMNHSTIWCNGKQVGERPYGYSSFTCDLTGALKPGENVIAVRVDHTQYADSRWYAGSGIYRNVWLNITDAIHVAPNGTSITTPAANAQTANIDITTTVKNDSSAAAVVGVVSTIMDASGKVVATVTDSAEVPAGASREVASVTRVDRPELWMPGHPAMYTAQTKLYKGSPTANTAVDTCSTPFGIRNFKFDPAKGFSINGESTKLKGVCLHHDAGVLGAAVPIQVWERRLKLLQEAGVNAIRCSHNPPDPQLLDLYDRMGFLVMDEAFDEWTGGKHKWILAHNRGTPGTDGYHTDFEKWADIDIKDMVTRDRNHPSIIMWSIGNEIDYTNDPWPANSQVLPPIAARLIKDVKEVDTTRPVTAACAFPATNLFKELLDIEGYNYMERLYAGDHAAHPDRVMYGSENYHSLAAWQAVADNDFISGQFLWTGIDYLGEAGAWPAHGSGAGLLTLAGFPKTQYYFRQSLWADKPMVYLFTGTAGRGGRGGRGRGGLPPGQQPAATSPGRASVDTWGAGGGSAVLGAAPGGGAGFGGRARGGPGGAPGAAPTISCYTNCDSVELFINDQSQGVKTHNAGDTLTWPLPAGGGTAKAVAKKGNETVSFELRQAGAAAKLAIVPDVTTLKADRRDVAQIELDVTDAAGVWVQNASVPVTCQLTGPGKILGIESGNLNTTEAYPSMTRTTYQGRLMIYVESEEKAGELELTVTSPNLLSGIVKLPVK